MAYKSITYSLEKKISDLTKFVKTDKALFTNFLSLALVQFTNFALPLLTYPYLFRVLGDNYFGSITYAFNVMLYLSTFSDYGFNLSAPRTIALNRHEQESLTSSVSVILQAKLYLFLISCILIGLCILLVPRFQNDGLLYGFGILYVAGTCALPTWLFQGLEDMRHLTWINLLAKIGATLLVFLLINEPSDYKYVIALFGIANLVSGIAGILYAVYKYKLKLKWVPFPIIYVELRKGWYYFLSSFSSVMFSNSTVFVLGFFVANDILGKYGIAEKITFAIWQLINVFSQATYPVLCRLSIESHTSVLKFMRKYYLSFSILIGIVCLILAVTAGSVIQLATGTIQPDTITLLRLLSAVPFIVCLNISAYQMLLIYQKQKYNFVIFNATFVLSILLSVSLAALYGAVGAAVATIITQIALTLSLHWVLEKYFPEYTLWQPYK